MQSNLAHNVAAVVARSVRQSAGIGNTDMSTYPVLPHNTGLIIGIVKHAHSPYCPTRLRVPSPQCCAEIQTCAPTPSCWRPFRPPLTCSPSARAGPSALEQIHPRAPLQYEMGTTHVHSTLETKCEMHRQLSFEDKLRKPKTDHAINVMMAKDWC